MSTRTLHPNSSKRAKSRKVPGRRTRTVVENGAVRRSPVDKAGSFAERVRAGSATIEHDGRLGKWGNSLATRFTKAMLAAAGVTADQHFDICAANGVVSLVFRAAAPTPRRLTFEQVMAEAKARKVPTRDITHGELPRGREVL